MFDPIPDPIADKSIIAWAAPVTRALNAIGDKVGATARNERDRRASTPLPWSFACTIEEGGEGEEETRTGGWTNCRLQIGLDVSWRSPDIDADDPYHTILGTDLCDDGTHYLEVTLANGVYDPEAGIDRLRDAAEIKVASPGESVPASDYVGGIIRIPLGTVTDGKIGYTPHFNPVVYKYL